MMIKHKRLILSIFLILVFSLITSTAIAQTGGQYFPETDRWVEEPFLTFYRNTDNPENIFGYPITNAYETSWTTVQYFQNLRLELDNLGKVMISPLGDLFYDKSEGELANQFRSSNSNCQMDDHWEFPVCFEFLDFFKENGGESIFGKPISEMKYYGDILVQNFYNTRFEWHPNQPGNQNVKLTNLGSIYLNSIGENQGNAISLGENNFDTIADLNIWGFITKLIVSKNDSQTLVVSVKDQNNHPVEAVNIFVNVIYNNNFDNPQQTIPIYTDINGIANIDFLVLEENIGEVQLIIVANYKNITQTTRSSFLIWY